MLSVTKTDEIDARLIALYGERMQPDPYKLRSDSILVLKQKRTVLRQLKKQLVATRNLKGSMEFFLLLTLNARKPSKRRLLSSRSKSRQWKRISLPWRKASTGNRWTCSPPSKASVLHWQPRLSWPQAGFTYFDNAKQLTRYLGLSPIYQQFGTSVNVKGHINQNGDSNLRSQLYVAAFSSLRCNAECKACFDRLRSNGKPGKVAVVAVANKLIRQAFAVVTQGKPYVDGFKSEKP